MLQLEHVVEVWHVNDTDKMFLKVSGHYNNLRGQVGCIGGADPQMKGHHVKFSFL